MNKENIVNTLFIGMGGTGIELGTRLKAFLVKEFGSLSAVEGKVKFLFIDTDSNFKSTLPNYMGIDISVADSEKLPIGLSQSDQSKIIDTVYFKKLGGDNENFAKHDFTKGAGARRSYGRAAIKFKYSEVKKVIQDNCTRIMSDQDNNYNIIMACSFLGGTGSGVFIDVSLITTEFINSKGGKTVLYGMTSLPNMDEGKMQNLLASLSEIEFISNSKGLFKDLKTDDFKEFYEGGYSLDIKNTPLADYIFLSGNQYRSIQGSSGASNSSMNYETIYANVVKHIYYTQIYQSTHSKFSEVRNNYEGIINYSPQSLTQIFNTFGVFSIELPVENIISGIIAESAVNYIDEKLNEKETFNVKIDEKIILDFIRQDLNALYKDDFKKSFEDCENELSLEENKKKPAKESRKNIYNTFVDFISNLKDKYGDNNNDFLYLKQNRDLESDEKADKFFKEKITEQLNQFNKNGAYNKILLTLDTLSHDIDVYDKSIQSRLETIKSQRLEIYNDLKKRVDILIREINKENLFGTILISLDDAKNILEKAKEQYDKFIEETKNFLIYYFAVKLINNLKNKIKNSRDLIESNNIKKEKELKEGLQKRLNEIKDDVVKNMKALGGELNSNSYNIDQIIKNVDLKDELKEYINFEGVGNNINKIISDSRLINSCKIKLGDRYDITNYTKDSEQKKYISEEISKNLYITMELSGQYSNDFTFRNDSKDEIRFIFTPKKCEQCIEVSKFQSFNTLETSDKIVAISEISGLPLKTFEIFEKFLKNIRSNKNVGDRIYNAFTYKNGDKILEIIESALNKKDNFEGDKAKTAGSYSELSVKASEDPEIISLSNYQIKQIGICLGLIKEEDQNGFCYYDLNEIKIPTEENGIPLPESKMLDTKIKPFILKKIKTDKKNITEEIKKYIKTSYSKMSNEGYNELYKELVENFLNKLEV